MISFQFRLTTGPIFNVQDNPNEYFHTVLSKFLIRNNLINIKIDFALNNGGRIDMNKSLAENNITQGSIVVLKTEKTDDIIPNNNISPNIALNAGQSIIPNTIPINNLNDINSTIRFLNNNLNANNAVNPNSILIFSPGNSFLSNNGQTIPIIATIQPLNTNLFNNTNFNNNFNNNTNFNNDNNFNNNTNFNNNNFIFKKNLRAKKILVI